MPRKKKPNKGDRPPRKHATAAEHDEHIDYAVNRLMVCGFPSEVTRDLCLQFDLDKRQASRILEEAREKIKAYVEEETNQPQLPAAFLVYTWVIRQAATLMKLDAMTRARARIDRLMGLDKVDATDANKDALIQALLEELKKPPPPTIGEEEKEDE